MIYPSWPAHRLLFLISSGVLSGVFSMAYIPLLQPHLEDLKDRRPRPDDSGCARVDQRAGDVPTVATGVINASNAGHLTCEVDLGGTSHVEVDGAVLTRCWPLLGNKGISIALVPMCMFRVDFVACLH